MLHHTQQRVHLVFFCVRVISGQILSENAHQPPLLPYGRGNAHSHDVSHPRINPYLDLRSPPFRGEGTMDHLHSPYRCLDIGHTWQYLIFGITISPYGSVRVNFHSLWIGLSNIVPCQVLSNILPAPPDIIPAGRRLPQPIEAHFHNISDTILGTTLVKTLVSHPSIHNSCIP